MGNVSQPFIKREFLQLSRQPTQPQDRCKKRDINPIQHTFYAEAYNLLIVQIDSSVVVVSCARLQA